MRAQNNQVPNTPAGQVLAAFLEAFNSQDKAKLKAYIDTYQPAASLDDLRSMADRSQGFIVVSIENSGPRSIVFRVRENSTATERLGDFVLSSVDPPKVETWAFAAIPPNAKVKYHTLDSQRHREIVEDLAVRLRNYYVYSKIAEQMAVAIQDHLRRGDYDKLADGFAFANALNHDLAAVSHDMHLHVVYDPFDRPKGSGPNNRHKPSPEALAHLRVLLDRANCTFSKAEILPGNVGYVKFDAFADPSLCGGTASAAINFVARADAIIIDLRDNGGGDPAMVQYICSYLFDGAVHLNDFYNRHDDLTTQYWTYPYISAVHITARLYVLTSAKTFSAAEEFAYDLKTQKRATIVGAITAGGAHPLNGSPFPTISSSQFQSRAPSIRLPKQIGKG